MTALAWPAVALVLGLVLIWRLDRFTGQLDLLKNVGQQVGTLTSWLKDIRDHELPGKASAAELAAVREKLTQIQARLGPPK